MATVGRTGIGEYAIRVNDTILTFDYYESGWKHTKNPEYLYGIHIKIWDEDGKRNLTLTDGQVQLLQDVLQEYRNTKNG